MKKIVLFINNVSATCGVYQHGKLVSQLLSESDKYSVIYKECDSIDTVVSLFNTLHPDIIVYNYHPSLFSFLVQSYGQLRSFDNVMHVGLITDGTQEVLLNPQIHDNLVPGGRVGTQFCPPIFDRYLFMDPETVETEFIKKVLPTIPKFDKTKKSLENKVVTVGSFGFGGSDKGYAKLVKKVQSEFDEAIIKIHIPLATYGDKDGIEAYKRVEECLSIISKPGIQLVATHDFLPEEELLDQIHSNDINIYYYNDSEIAQGVASTPHFGIAVDKPFLVSNTSKTRHLIGVTDKIDINTTTIQEAINNYSQVKDAFGVWSRENTLQSYEKVFDEMFIGDRFYGASEPKLDQIIASAFASDYKGVCIDIGAGDGKLGSNSLYFERKGWECLCIEPNVIYEDYLRLIRKNVVIAAISSDTTLEIKPLHVFKVRTTAVHDGDPPHQYGALTSLEVDQKLYDRFKSEGMILEEYDVPTRILPLTDCIEENNFPTVIDFISIDTEGTELDVVKSIDFEKIKVNLFVIENNFGTTEVEDYLANFGYVKAAYHDNNDFFALKASIE